MRCARLLGLGAEHVNGPEHPLRLMQRAVVGIDARGREGEGHAAAAVCTLNRIVWTSSIRAALLAGRQARLEGMIAESAVLSYRLSNGHR